MKKLFALILLNLILIIFLFLTACVANSVDVDSENAASPESQKNDSETIDVQTENLQTEEELSNYDYSINWITLAPEQNEQRQSEIVEYTTFPATIDTSSSSYKEAYINIINELEETHEDFEYDLIYLDDDNIPELVVQNGSFISVYTYSSDELYIIMGGLIGFMGINGYDYIPKANVIRNYDIDLAGAIVYIVYGKINESHEIQPYYDETLSEWIFKDLDNNHQMSEDEYNGIDSPYYYLGDKEITKEEFESYLIDGDYESICGEKSASELIAQLEHITTADNSTELVQELKKYIADNSLDTKVVDGIEMSENYLPCIAAIPEKNIYLYGFNKNSMLLKSQGKYEILNYGWLTPRLISPEISLYDYDSDGQEELAIKVYQASGTGVSLWSLIMVEINDEAEQYDDIFYRFKHTMFSYDDIYNTVSFYIKKTEIYEENDKYFFDIYFTDGVKYNIDITEIQEEYGNTAESNAMFMNVNNIDIENTIIIKLPIGYIYDDIAIAFFIPKEVCAEMAYNNGNFHINKIWVETSSYY